MKKYITTTIIILGALLFITYIITKNKRENKEKTDIVAQKSASVSVRIDTVKLESVSLNFVANGNFEPLQELNFSAEKPSRVVKVLVDKGSYVTVGQTLAIVRSDKISADLHTAEAAYENALADYNRFESAFQTGGVTKQQLDQASLNLVTSESRLQQAKINVGDTQIKATIKGIINKRYIEPGSVLRAATLMFDIVDVSKLKLKVTVSENQVTRLKLGNTIKVKASVYPNKEFVGKITFIAPRSDSSLNFPVEIEISNNFNIDLKAGMYGTAIFESTNNQNQSILIAPRDAFIGSVSSNQVFVIENETAKLKTVRAGRILGDKVEILKGLESDDIVIVTGQINLQEGSNVEIIE